MDFQLGLISPYKKLTNEAIEIAKTKHISLYARTAGFEEAIVCAKDMEKSGIDVIIARQITDSFLEGKINIPLVPIRIRTLDILKAIVKAKQTTNKNTIVLANFRNCYQDIEILEKATDCIIKQFAFYSEEEANKKLKDFACKYEVLVGGGYTTYIAPKYNMRAFLIESTQESLECSMVDACNLAKSRLQEQQRLKELSIIINQSTDGIVTADVHGNITVFNPKAAKIFGLTLDEITQSNKEYIMKITGLSNVLQTRQSVYEELVNINSKKYIIRSVLTIVNQDVSGGVCTLQEVSRVQRTEQETRAALHGKGLEAKIHFEDIIGQSEAIKDAICKAKKFARTDFTLLIIGETGTGKEAFAQSIHNYSKRNNGPFVAINCTAIPDNLLEAELFGYEEGAFTGAKKGGKPGLFELAHNGTILLDEIGDLPLAMQARLLRVIQEKEMIRIGGSKVMPVDVRIIASTNSHLFEKVLEGKFREDLYYRLSVLYLYICPLRERRDDIPLIARHYLKRFNAKEHDINIILLALSTLQDYQWKGNIRELENVLAKFSVLLEYNEMSYDALINELKNMCYSNNSVAKSSPEIHNFCSLKKVNSKTEYELICQMLKENLSHHQIAQKLGISRTTLWRKLKNFN